MGKSPLSRASCLTASALLLIGPAVLAAVSADAAFNPIPVLTLSLSPTQLEAAVSDTQNGPVMFSGNASVEMFPLLKVTVTLSASCIWPAIITPSTMTFDSTRPQEFYVTVVVPPKTSAMEVGQLIVTGAAKAPGLPISTASANAVVTVRQYFGLEVSVLGGPFEGQQAGGTVSGKLVVNNTGNGLDSIVIELLDPQAIVSTRDIRRGIDVKPRESEEVPFTLHLNESLGSGNFSRDIAFVCTSTEAVSGGTNCTRTTWCTISFSAKRAGPGGEVPPGGGGDGDGATTSGDGGGFPTALVVLVVLIVILSAIAYLGRERAGPGDAIEAAADDPQAIGGKA